MSADDSDLEESIRAKKRNDDFSSTQDFAGHGFEITVHASGNEHRGEKAAVLVGAVIRDYLRGDDRFIPGGLHRKREAVDARFETERTTLTVAFKYAIHGDHDADVADDVFEHVADTLVDRAGDTIKANGIEITMPHAWKRTDP